ncbi:MAG: hypothetical protein ACYDH9_21495 [Limisphaerales bacterium]
MAIPCDVIDADKVVAMFPPALFKHKSKILFYGIRKTDDDPLGRAPISCDAGDGDRD